MTPMKIIFRGHGNIVNLLTFPEPVLYRHGPM
jgi:hypothetical protein